MDHEGQLGQTIGALTEAVDTLKAEVQSLRDQVQRLIEAYSEAKGALRVVTWVCALAASVATTAFIRSFLG